MSTDRETIRMWADEYDAVPLRHTAAEDDHLHIAPEADATGDYERIDWDEFFDEFEARNNVVIFHEDRGRDPLEVAGRDDVIGRSEMDAEEFENRIMEGEIVTSEITETTVVESVVVEETTVESELIDSEIVDRRVTDAELVGRECKNCEFVEDREVEHRDLFDAERYFGSSGATTSDRTGGETGTLDEGTRDEGTSIEAGDEFPYHAELDVDETWTVTVELRERFTVESRIAGTEVTEADTIEDHDIDVEGLHRSIVEGGIIDVEHGPDEVLTEYDIESSLAEEDRIQTHFERVRLVEDEVVDRKQLRADVTGSEFYEMETISTRDIPADERETVTDTTVGSTAADETGTTVSDGTETNPTHVTLTDDDIGKKVVDDNGDDVGRVTGVEEGGEVIYVDPHQSITERIQAALGWEDEDEYPLRTEHIERVTDDRVELKGHEELPKR